MRMLHRIAGHLQATAPPRQLSASATSTTLPPPLLAEDAIPEVITEAHSLPLSAAVRRLTDAETAQFHEDGFITGLPLFAEAAVPHLQAKALEMFEQLEREAPGTRVDKVRPADVALAVLDVQQIGTVVHVQRMTTVRWNCTR